MTFNWQTCMLPDTDEMAEYAMSETTIYMALAATGQVYLVSALDQDGNTLNSATLFQPGSATLWGSFTWGSVPWGSQKTSLGPQSIPWSAPVQFRRVKVGVTGQSSLNFKISTMHLRYQQLGYMQVYPPSVIHSGDFGPDFGAGFGPST